MAQTLNIEGAWFVRFAELFRDLPLLADASMDYCSYTLGDANHTLIDLDTIVHEATHEATAGRGLDDLTPHRLKGGLADDASQAALYAECQILKERVDYLRSQKVFLVDVEN